MSTVKSKRKSKSAVNPSKRVALGLLGLVALNVTIGCFAPLPWEPYERAAPELQTTWNLNRNPQRAEFSAGCVKCHENSKDPHATELVTCVDCHGGNGKIGLTKEEAHPKPDNAEDWPTTANPVQAYMMTVKENWDWIRFVNPGDLRVAQKTCGVCHDEHTLNVRKSLMTTAAHFYGTAAYANGILPVKRTLFGESYDPHGTPQIVNTIMDPKTNPRLPTDEEVAEQSISKTIVPLPNFEVTQPGNIYRVFERGSRLGGTGLGLNGLPAPIPGLPDKFEDPGRPNNRGSDRGLGTLTRVDLPTLNLHKTRLNDPHLSMFGTNDNPGDFRSSGCTACHMVYANDRDPVHSGPWAKYGNAGKGNTDTPPWSKSPWDTAPTPDPHIPADEAGHPIVHKFTTAIPSSQCMVCHMHQPNSFLNTYYGYQMWSYETDGKQMWPKTDEPRNSDTNFEIADRNPEGAAQRGKWSDPKFLERVAEDINPQLKHTQFADYHGHGWIFRAVLKADRDGNLLDKDGEIVPYDKADKFEGMIPPLGQHPVDLESFKPKPGQPVHLKDIHAELGMHCVDCHFSQDVHGDGRIYSEYQAAVQIRCQDCHGTIDERATLKFSGPAAKKDSRLDGGQRTPWKELRFERNGDGSITQRSMLYPDLKWTVTQIKDSVDPTQPDKYNEKAAYAKTQKTSTGECAHSPKTMDCASCHTSWMTSCFGCHLPQQADVRAPLHRYEEKWLRNLASYNPQVARDDVFMLGISPNVKKNVVAAVRSSSAVMVSSEDSQRRIIYKQQPTVAANGMNGQCFNTHFAHTVRKTETRGCSDCHLSTENDNNAWLAQTYLMGTNYVNFFGMHAYVGLGSGGFEAVKWTEWPEPQAVIGSDLHAMAYPKEFKDHLANDKQLDAEHHGGTDIQSVVHRGEYVYVASGSDGFRVYDVANVANKDFSEKLVTSPVSPLGQDTHVPTKYATAVALPTNMPISMARKYRPENQEQNYPYRGEDRNMHESYRYAYVSDREEGMIVVDIDCLTDGDPQNNFLERALRFNPGKALVGAENITVAGTTAYVCCDSGVVAVDIADPLKPSIIATVGAPAINKPNAIEVQFRYAFVTDADGLKVLDITTPKETKAVETAKVELQDARGVYVARTYAYVAGGAAGLVIVDVKNPEQPKVVQTFNANGAIKDLNDVKVGMAYDSLYALLADGTNGFHVLQLVTPKDGGRSAYGFAPEPRPVLIASRETSGPAMAIAKGLDRDRAVDESGHQVAVFGRIGGRPFNLKEMQNLYLKDGKVVRFPDEPPEGWKPGTSAAEQESSKATSSQQRRPQKPEQPR